MHAGGHGRRCCWAARWSAGIGQLFRLLRGEPVLRGLGPSLGLVLIPWLALYLFITVRLASVLGLIA